MSVRVITILIYLSSLIKTPAGFRGFTSFGQNSPRWRGLPAQSTFGPAPYQSVSVGPCQRTWVHYAYTRRDCGQSGFGSLIQTCYWAVASRWSISRRWTSLSGLAFLPGHGFSSRARRKDPGRRVLVHGKYLLSSSDKNLSAEDIALGYKQLMEVERAFRVLNLKGWTHSLPCTVMLLGAPVGAYCRDENRSQLDRDPQTDAAQLHLGGFLNKKAVFWGIPNLLKINATYWENWKWSRRRAVVCWCSPLKS